MFINNSDVMCWCVLQAWLAGRLAAEGMEAPLKPQQQKRAGMVGAVVYL